MRAVWQAVLFSALWISLCATALAVESCLILQVPLPDTPRLLFVFAATCCHYNLHYLFRTPDPARSVRDHWAARHRGIVQLITLAAAVPAAGMLVWFTPTELLIIAGAVAASAAYSLPLLPSGWRLRNLGVLKPFVLALVWAVITVWLPAHAGDPYLLLLVALRRFVFMLTLCLAFDVRDVDKDRAHGVFTFPIRWGKGFTYALIDVLLVAFVVLAALVEADKRRPAVATALAISAFCTALAVRLTKRWTSEEYYLGVIDGMMLLQAALVALAIL